MPVGSAARVVAWRRVGDVSRLAVTSLRVVSYRITRRRAALRQTHSRQSRLSASRTSVRSLARSITRVCPRRVVHSARSRLSFASPPYHRVLTGAAVPAHSTHSHGHRIPSARARAHSLVRRSHAHSRLSYTCSATAAPRRDVTQPPLLCPLSSRLVSRSRARSSALGGNEASRPVAVSGWRSGFQTNDLSHRRTRIVVVVDVR